MTSYEYNDFLRRIENATSRSELLNILRELKEKFDESDPDVKVLVKKLTR